MRLLVPAAAAAALLALAGCSDPEPGSPLPSGAPTETSTTTASPAPSTTTPTDDATAAQPSPAPTLPPAATTDDAAGAEAFVRYWYDALNHAFSTGDTGALLAASSPECDACVGLSRVIEEAYADGGAIRGGAVSLTDVVSPTPDGTGAVLLSVVYDQAPSSDVAPDGRVEDSQAGSTQVSQSAVIQRTEDDGGWLMFGLAR